MVPAHCFKPLKTDRSECWKRVLGEAIVIWCAGLSVQCVPELFDTFQAFLRVSPTPTVSPDTPHSIPLFQWESNILAPPSPLLHVHSERTLKKTKTTLSNLWKLHCWKETHPIWKHLTSYLQGEKAENWNRHHNPWVHTLTSSSNKGLPKRRWPPWLRCGGIGGSSIGSTNGRRVRGIHADGGFVGIIQQEWIA